MVIAIQLKRICFHNVLYQYSLHSETDLRLSGFHFITLEYVISIKIEKKLLNQIYLVSYIPASINITIKGFKKISFLQCETAIQSKEFFL